jgi:hypothetical protein
MYVEALRRDDAQSKEAYQLFVRFIVSD